MWVKVNEHRVERGVARLHTRDQIMNEVESKTKSNIGLDRATVWIIVTGLVAVFIGVGTWAVCLFTDPDSAFWFSDHVPWVAAGGALLCAAGGWRAARRWLAIGRHTTFGTVK